MGWKKWPGWLKGGLIGVIVGLLSPILIYVLLIFFGLIVSVLGKNTNLGYNLIKLTIYLNLFSRGCANSCIGNPDCALGCAIISPFIVLIETIILGAFIGAIIGWITQKSKSRK